MAKAPATPLWGLRDRREFRGITQTDMGTVIGANQSHYRQLETGGVRLDVHRAKLLADHLGCTIDQLL